MQIGYDLERVDEENQHSQNQLSQAMRLNRMLNERAKAELNELESMEFEILKENANVRTRPSSQTYKGKQVINSLIKKLSQTLWQKTQELCRRQAELEELRKDENLNMNEQLMSEIERKQDELRVLMQIREQSIRVSTEIVNNRKKELSQKIKAKEDKILSMIKRVDEGQRAKTQPKPQ